MLNTNSSISFISGIHEIATQNSGFAEGDNKSDESDPINNDENDSTCRKRTRKRHQSKNLEAERKRRKKLNDKLYSLRELVPNISELDRGAILGDAINYVQELKELVKDLQIELEEQSDDEHARVTAKNSVDNTMPIVLHSVTKRGPKYENVNDKMQQMEPNVEVFQVGGNEFFVKVFCEHKAGGFVRLVEALNHLGLEVIQVNATRHTCLVSNIFRVKKKTSEVNFQVDHMKKPLLELARNSFSHILLEN